MGDKREKAIGAILDRIEGAATLKIDLAIRGLFENKGKAITLTPQWTLERAIAFGRRSLEVAYFSMLDGEEEHKKSEQLQEWKNAQLLSIESRAALRSLLLFLSPTDVKFNKPGALAVPLYRKAKRENPSASPSAISAIARAQADTLLAAVAVLDEMPKHFEENRLAMVVSMKNPGAPERAWFMYRLAEAWIYLVGKLPGKNKDSSKNPFLRFTMAGWEDIGGKYEDGFGSFLHDALSGRTSFGPLTFSDAPPVWAQGL